MAHAGYAVRPLDESTLTPFTTLVEQNNGVFGGCWCMGFHAEGVGGKDDTHALNRERKFELVRAGTTHAALVFDGDHYVGSCQFGAPEELPGIKCRAAYERDRKTSPDWRIACRFVGKAAGALSTYEKLGFARDGKIGKHRWEVTATVAPA